MSTPLDRIPVHGTGPAHTAVNANPAVNAAVDAALKAAALPLPRSGKPPEVSAPRGWAPFALGFRPFYLGAMAFGTVAMPLWLAMTLGWIGASAGPAMPSLLWHAHEMVFGFAAAVVVGFLFTAAKNWTGLQTPRGPELAALFAIWLGARMLMWTGPLPAAQWLDAIFLPLCGALLLRVLMRAGSRRNYGLAAALFLLGGLNVAFHLLHAFDASGAALRAADAGVGLIAVFVTVIGGRVIPMFSANAVPGLAITRRPLAEKAVAPLTLATALALAVAPYHAATGVLAGAAALAHGIRLAGWNSIETRRVALVWILHLAYAWLPVGFALLALASFGIVPASAGLHALTVGAIGCAILGMVTRTALGHTGRRLQAGPMERAAYWCIAAAALVRVAGPLAWPAWRPVWLATSTVLWSLSTAIYLMAYTRPLLTPRVDGKEG